MRAPTLRRSLFVAFFAEAISCFVLMSARLLRGKALAAAVGHAVRLLVRRLRKKLMIAALLRARHFKVLTTQETNRLGPSDKDQVDFAVQNEMAFLTHNREHLEKFFQEYLEKGKGHYGIIIAKQRPANEILKRFLKILNFVTADELESQIRYI